ncbi:hypothetical protein [Synechocystis salina]|nr:hypothetical protein [Synechocystis salina]
MDDIITTGTTALEARRVMEEKGAKVWGIVAIATPSFSQPMELRQHR